MERTLRRSPAILLGCVLHDAIVEDNERTIDRVCHVAIKASRTGRDGALLARCVEVATFMAQLDEHADAAQSALALLRF